MYSVILFYTHIIVALFMAKIKDYFVICEEKECVSKKAEQLKDCILGDELLLPRTVLRSEGDLFLCDMTPKELTEQLGVPIRFVSNDGADFLDAVLGCGGELLGE